MSAPCNGLLLPTRWCHAIYNRVTNTHCRSSRWSWRWKVCIITHWAQLLSSKHEFEVSEFYKSHSMWRNTSVIRITRINPDKQRLWLYNPAKPRADMQTLWHKLSVYRKWKKEGVTWQEQWRRGRNWVNLFDCHPGNTLIKDNCNVRMAGNVFLNTFI